MQTSIRHVAPGRLEVRDGGGGMALFGLPFFCSGVWLVLVSVGLYPLSNDEQAAWFMWPAMFFLGAVFTTVGGALVFGRSWTTFDAGARTVTVQYGLLVPMRTTTHRIDDQAVVRLGFERGDSDTADQYPVTLKGPVGPDLKLFSPPHYAVARHRAAAIASLFNLEIEDRTTDHPVRLAPGQAALPLQHRARIEHHKEEIVAKPGEMSSEVTEEHGMLRILIPRRRTHSAWFLFYAVPLAVPLFVFRPLSEFFRHTRTPDVVSWGFLGFLAMAFGLLPLYSGVSAYLRSRRGRTIVTVTSAGIEIEERRIVRTRKMASLAATDIMDIDFSTTDSMLVSSRRTAEDIARRRPAMQAQPVGATTERVLVTIGKLTRSGGVTIKTNHALTTFGEHLPDDEISYLYSLVKRQLIYGSG